jgi:hypothetical protein
MTDIDSEKKKFYLAPDLKKVRPKKVANYQKINLAYYKLLYSFPYRDDIVYGRPLIIFSCSSTYLSRYAHPDLKLITARCTKVRFSSFLSGGFNTIAVINPPESKLAKRTSVHCANSYSSIFC